MVNQRNNSSEWIPLSDMLACCVAVLLMVILVIEQRPSIAQMQGSKSLREALIDISEGSDGAIGFYESDRFFRLDLTTKSFEIGSPELTPFNRKLITDRSNSILAALRDSFIIRIEGHADANPLYSSNLVTVTSPDLRRNRSNNLYSKLQYSYDNVLLSLQRAMEVKRIFSEQWKLGLNQDDFKNAIEKVSVSGYGSNRPSNLDDPTAEENRRVEIYFEPK